MVTTVSFTNRPYLILDTNILLLDANNIYTLGQSYTLVLPETVMDEIDHKKSSSDPEIRYQVRELGRILTKGITGTVFSREALTIVPLSLDKIDIHIVSRSHYDNTDNDRKIIQIAIDYSTVYDNVTFMTNDIMCRFRAISYGLNTTDLRLIDDRPLEFTRTLIVPSELFPNLHNKPITDVDPSYEPQIYNYVFVDATTEQTKLGTLRNGFIDIIGKDSEADLRKQDAVPANMGHLFMSRAIQNPNVDIVVVEARAGTGKTLTVFSNAIQLVKRKEYGGIIYFRTSVDDVEKAEEQGFRKGSNEEKNAPFFGPVEDTLDFIARRRNNNSQLKGSDYEKFIIDECVKLRERYNIEESTNLGLRGRTFNNIVAIIDEGQNYSKAALQKLLTRFGKNCKIIIIGSNRQIDHPYVSKYTNGLSVLLEACTETNDKATLHGIQLDRVLRSDIAAFAEDIFTKDYRD